ncbi:hypothetical protein [Nonomuraea insulae]|uniref:Uncharacterized protein n=1 Tax=Nonomuraea insulae TaxID=1616787 RepID=A0ABW1D0D4_9ACTN
MAEAIDAHDQAILLPQVLALDEELRSESFPEAAPVGSCAPTGAGERGSARLHWRIHWR